MAIQILSSADMESEEPELSGTESSTFAADNNSDNLAAQPSNVSIVTNNAGAPSSVSVPLAAATSAPVVESSNSTVDFLSSALTQAQIDLGTYQFMEEDDSAKIEPSQPQTPSQDGSTEVTQGRDGDASSLVVAETNMSQELRIANVYSEAVGSSADNLTDSSGTVPLQQGELQNSNI